MIALTTNREGIGYPILNKKQKYKILDIYSYLD